MKKPIRIAITTGDIDGIGLEITTKALARIKPKKGVQFFLWRSPKASKKDLKILDSFFHRKLFQDWLQACKQDYNHKILFEIESQACPAKWVEWMAEAGLASSIDALITAPISKTEIQNAGLKDCGHTDILKRVTGQKNVFMAFLGKKFNVVLLTDHIPIEKVAERINEDLLEACILKTHEFKKHLDSKQTKPIGLVGLNPHASEKGIIGKQETRIFQNVLKKIKTRNIAISQPLVSDVCFQKKFWKNYSFYIASYHDQGLIPFKMIHSDNHGVQISVGLPFLRVSVDHGTAKDLFGKNKADPTSMEQALRVAIKILKNKSIG